MSDQEIAERRIANLAEAARELFNAMRHGSTTPPDRIMKIRDDLGAALAVYEEGGSAPAPQDSTWTAYRISNGHIETWKYTPSDRRWRRQLHSGAMGCAYTPAQFIDIDDSPTYWSRSAAEYALSRQQA